MIAAVEYEGDYLKLTFAEPLDSQLEVQQFQTVTGQNPEALLFEENGRVLVLRFDPVPSGMDTLRWTDVHDREGTPLGVTSVEFKFPEAVAQDLILSSWQVRSADTAVLTFNQPLLPEAARNLGNYRVAPDGMVADVMFDEARPMQVELRIQGRVLGAVGYPTTIVVLDMESTTGAILAPEGNVASLVDFAEDLTDVYVYPNPYRADQHGARLTIAGLPRRATIHIYSAQGIELRTLEELDGNGGVEWDLQDAMGVDVPSGIYLIQVEAEGLETILTKAAIIR